MKRRNETTIGFLDFGSHDLSQGLATLTNISKDGRKYFLTHLRGESDGQNHCLYVGLIAGFDIVRAPFEEVKESLSRIHGPVAITAVTNNGGFMIKIEFELPSKGGFCENVLEFAFALLLHLEFDLTKALKIVQGFRLAQTQQVKYHGTWINYNQYLILTHRLLRSKTIK